MRREERVEKLSSTALNGYILLRQTIQVLASLACNYRALRSEGPATGFGWDPISSNAPYPRWAAHHLRSPRLHERNPNRADGTQKDCMPPMLTTRTVP